MISRRQLLWGMGGTLGVIAGVMGWRFFRATDAQAIEMIVARRLNYLKLDAGSLKKFAADMAARKQLSSAKLRTVPALGSLYDYLPESHNFILDAVRNGEERIVSMFLLSSDFFINGADEARLVSYLEMYDPLKACRNPFARPMTTG